MSIPFSILKKTQVLFQFAHFSHYRLLFYVEKVGNTQITGYFKYSLRKRFTCFEIDD